MQTLKTPTQLDSYVDSAREQERRIAFVPTMGNLHQGHLKLVEVAKRHGDIVIVSIFVNPAQFGPGEDLDKYPRTLDQDLQKLIASSVDAVFTPSVEDMYPEGTELEETTKMPELYRILEGTHRPTHFQGVARVVHRFFDMIRPDVAIFGEKDFQQLLVIQQLVREQSLPIEIVPVPTVRESGGLAMSSRNGFLSPKQRRQAALLYQVLEQTRDKVINQVAELTSIEQEAIGFLEKSGFAPNYIAIRNAETLMEPKNPMEPLVILAAVRLGDTRLIDNLRV